MTQFTLNASNRSSVTAFFLFLFLNHVCLQFFGHCKQVVPVFVLFCPAKSELNLNSKNKTTNSSLIPTTHLKKGDKIQRTPVSYALSEPFSHPSPSMGYTVQSVLLYFFIFFYANQLMYFPVIGQWLPLMAR